MHVADAVSVERFEFPMYWLDESGKAILQRFRDGDPGGAAGGLGSGAAQVMECQLSETEIECKKSMMAANRTQQGTVTIFTRAIVRCRPSTPPTSSFSVPASRSYL